ncbi:hypothetical protein MGYG_01613 [Nannizzia gypsea CBS 118893]|uniref:Uncharacterized protein n=1 Tax=Arthroderma gypseum (strain ATCC MYA-4604 / CBS 118893) TaxID=535722 RepID=E5R1V3_ARTGP|nr:hypothetical protein MGYG_01613 [Nannizzia gypsea CBS 118893]EFQ98587.1 hypothetical protein MGYG_01613 [Nannizzia gypsea CBS 118893]
MERMKGRGFGTANETHRGPNGALEKPFSRRERGRQRCWYRVIVMIRAVGAKRQVSQAYLAAGEYAERYNERTFQPRILLSIWTAGGWPSTSSQRWDTSLPTDEEQRIIRPISCKPYPARRPSCFYSVRTKDEGFDLLHRN